MPIDTKKTHIIINTSSINTVLPRSIAPPVLSPTSAIAKILICPDFPH